MKNFYLRSAINEQSILKKTELLICCTIKKESDGIKIIIINANKRTTWKTKDTEISLNLTGDDYNFEFYIQYFSSELKPQYDADMEKNNLEDL